MGEVLFVVVSLLLVTVGSFGVFGAPRRAGRFAKTVTTTGDLALVGRGRVRKRGYRTSFFNVVVAVSDAEFCCYVVDFKARRAWCQPRSTGHRFSVGGQLPNPTVHEEASGMLLTVRNHDAESIRSGLTSRGWNVAGP